MILLTTDLHLTEKQEDEYRFDLFPWIVENFWNDVNTVIILGDLTDRKNYHADFFVNKIVDHIRALAKVFEVYVLCGNHDYDVDPTQPFFSFLGKYRNITYISSPKILQIPPNSPVLFLPHTRQPGNDWGILGKVKEVDAIFMHQTFNRSISESGKVLGGISSYRFRRFGCPIFSGDIHVPQQNGPITYVGCPYHIHYGDHFKPRVLLLNRKFATQNVQFPAPRKLMIDLNNGADLSKMHRQFHNDDRAKVKIHLPRSEFGNWPTHRDLVRKSAKKLGLKLHSVILKQDHDTKGNKRIKNATKIRTHSETFKAFCSKYEIEGDIAKAGSVFLEDENA